MEESVEMPTWTQVCSSLWHTEFLFLSITFKRTKCYRRLLTRQHKGKANKEGTVLGKQLGANFMNFSQLWWKSHMTKYTWITTSTLTPDLKEALHLNPFPGLKSFRDADNTRTAWSGFGVFLGCPCQHWCYKLELVFTVCFLQIKFLAWICWISRLPSFNANQIAFFIMFTHNNTEFVYYGRKAQTDSCNFWFTLISDWIKG